MGHAPIYGPEIVRASMVVDDHDGGRCDAGGRGGGGTSADLVRARRGASSSTTTAPFAVFVRGELLGIYSGDDVASRDVFIAVVAEQAEREDLALAFRVSPATVGRVITRFNRGGFHAVADYGRRGGPTVRTPKLEDRLAELFEKGLGPRAAHRAVAKKASYGTVHAIHQQWRAARATAAGTPAPTQAALTLIATSEASSDHVEAPATPAPAESMPAQESSGEPTLEVVVAPAGALVQHVGSWLLLGLLRQMGFYDLAARNRGEVALSSLRPAIDAAAIALALGEGCVEGVRRIATPSV